MQSVPGARLIAVTAILIGLAQPSFADSGKNAAPPKPPKAKSVSSAQMVQVKPDAGTTTPRNQWRVPVTGSQKAGGCQKSKPAFGDADFSFQGYDDAGIRC